MKMLSAIATCILLAASALAYTTNSAGYIVSVVSTDPTTPGYDTNSLQGWEDWADGDPLSRGDSKYAAECHSKGLGECVLSGWVNSQSQGDAPLVYAADTFRHPGFDNGVGAECGQINIQEDWTVVSNMVVRITAASKYGVIAGNSGQKWTVENCLLISEHSGSMDAVYLSALISSTKIDCYVKNCIITGPWQNGIHVYCVNDFFTSPRAELDVYYTSIDNSRGCGIKYTEQPSGPGTPRVDGLIYNVTATRNDTQDYFNENFYGSPNNGTVTGSHNADSDGTVTNVTSDSVLQNIVAANEFMAPDRGDLRLRADSQYFDAGTNLTSVTVDALGVARGDPPTIGAFEDAGTLSLIVIVN